MKREPNPVLGGVLLAALMLMLVGISVVFGWGWGLIATAVVTMLLVGGLYWTAE